MDRTIRQTIVDRLIADYQMRKHGQWLQQGKCPACHKKELFTALNAPWKIYCNRKNKCGWQAHIKTLYPDIFDNFNKRFNPTPDNPNATADAYLQYVRGFDIAQIKGWYQQGKFWQPNADKGTATVRFYIDHKNNVYMERFIEEITITNSDGEQKKRKAHFNGSYKGQWWQPPGMQINSGDTIWLVESCLDAIALHLNGQKAVALLSCNNYPNKQLALHNTKNVTWVWALDNDKAGQHSLHKWVKHSRDAGFNVKAASLPQTKQQKYDWNDCHISKQLSQKHRDRYLYYGSLLIANNPLEKALLMWEKQSSNGFCFDFNNRLYWFEVNLEKLSQAMENDPESDNAEDQQQNKMKAIQQSGTLSEIANCKITFLYFQANKLTDESWYYCKIEFPHNRTVYKNTFTGNQVATATEFKKRLLSIAPGGLFTGNNKQLDWLVKHYAQYIKIVDTIDFIGYSKAHQTYVFNDVAIHKGHVYPINKEDYFDIDALSIKSLNHSLQLQIGDTSDYYTQWPQLIYQAFGAKGLVAVSFWFGILFAEQIRAIHQSFPFLEIVGEPGSGKTTLVEFMWKLLGKADEEGFDPSKATMAAISRKFAQVSNLPVVLIEADREQDTAKTRKFDWDELKTAYNGRASRARGIKNSGNETYEPPFRGAIVIEQNAPVNASEAILQRIVQIKFDKSQHCAESKTATDRLNTLAVNQLSYFLKQAVVNEANIIESIKQNTAFYEKSLLSLPEIKLVRIAKNYAQIMALATAFSELVKLPETQYKATYQYIEQLAIERQHEIIADHPIVQQFWEIYDYLNDDDRQPVLNHSRNTELIAINLNHFVRLANHHKQQVPDLIELRKHLRHSKQRPFHAIKTVNSVIHSGQLNQANPKAIKCWIFLKENHHV